MQKIFGEAMMTKDEALKMAIGKFVLEKMTSGNDVPVSRCTITNVEIHALSKEALEQPAQEPVGFMHKETGELKKVLFDDDARNEQDWLDVYAHPTEFKTLKDDEVDSVWFEVVKENNFEGAGKYFARAIEQALKEKNANNP
jgi:hypothetical protein